tara:strand:+ start:10711 stop:11340 length:630 start_codon:yes stop_codon:yes gene_type:complete
MLAKKTKLRYSDLYGGVSVASRSDIKRCNELWDNSLKPSCLKQEEGHSLTDINKTNVFVVSQQSITDYFSSTKKSALDKMLKQTDFIIGLVELFCVLDEVEIRALVVDKKFRGKGLGEALLIASIEQSLIWSTITISLEVRISNYIAISLYNKYGFSIEGRRKKYYADTKEDAFIMKSPKLNSLEFQRLFQALATTHRDQMVKMFNVDS